MGISHQPALIQFEFTFFIHIGIINSNAYNICQKHIMASKMQYLAYFAGNVYRTFCNSRCRYLRKVQWCQMHGIKLVNVTAGFYATIIRGADQILRHKIYNKFAGFRDYSMGISFRTDRYRKHWRIRTYRSCPRYRNNIRFFCRSLAAYHHCWNRI